MELILHEWVLALWEGGSAAFGRADSLSDLDLVLVVEDGQTMRAVKLIEDVMSLRGGIESKWEVPQPTWHGAWQAFYRPRSENPYFMVDLCIAERSKPWTLTERERHGEPVILFDRIGAAAPTEMSEALIHTIVRTKLPQLEGALEMFADFPAKEMKRGRFIDALHWHQTLIMGRVVGLLRLRHCPARHDFGFRYLGFDLPEAQADLVEELMTIAGSQDLPGKTERAVALGRSVAQEIRATLAASDQA